MVLLLLFSCKNRDAVISTDLFNYSDKLVEDMGKLAQKSKYASLEEEFTMVKTSEFELTNKYIIPFFYYQYWLQYRGEGNIEEFDISQLEEFFKTTAQSVAMNELFYMEAQNQNIRVSASDINAEIMKIAQQATQGDLEKFKKDIADSPLSFEFVKRDVKHAIAIQRYEQEFIINNIDVDPAEVKKVYLSEPKYMYNEPKVKVRHILVMTEEGNEQKNKSAAEEIYMLKAKLDEGADFAELAQKFSDDKGTALNGGLLGDFVTPGQLVKDFEIIAFTTPEGETSQVFKTSYGYHILKVDKFESKGERKFEEVRPEIEYMLKSKDSADAILAEKERIKKKYNFEFIDIE